MRRAGLVALALVAAAPAQAYDCREAVEVAAFKREVAARCGYFVNTGPLEQRAQACVRRLNPGYASLVGRVGAHSFTELRQRVGLQGACKDVLRRMRSGFVAD